MRAAWALALALLVAAMCPALGDEAPPALADVPQGHWAYEAVEELLARGLIEGYPSGEFDGPRPATRFEMASLVVRAVRAMAQAMRQHGERLEQAIVSGQTAPSPITPAAAPRQDAPDAPPAVRPQDIARIEKLIAEFRTELVTMGVRADDLERELGDLRTVLTAVEQRVSGLETEARRHRIWGYVQVRYTDDEARDPRAEFAIRRARVNFSGPVSEKTRYRIQAQLDAKLGDGGPGSKVQLRDAYLTRRLGEASLRVGQAALPFGYELQMSPSRLLASERTLVMDQLFPDQRDIGVFAGWGRRPALDVALVNGSGINQSDENSRKDVVARLTFPLSRGSVRASYYDGRAGSSDETTVKSRAGVGARLDCGLFGLRAEYLRGRDLGKPVEGWYGEISRRLAPGPGTLFLRVDTYDEDRDQGDDRFRRTLLGYAHDLDAATRLTLAYEWRHLGERISSALRDGWDGDAGYVQMQVTY